MPKEMLRVKGAKFLILPIFTFEEIKGRMA
jgi:hypothetical protein